MWEEFVSPGWIRAATITFDRAWLFYFDMVIRGMSSPLKVSQREVIFMRGLGLIYPRKVWRLE
jgi:hypothetical protein